MSNVANAFALGLGMLVLASSHAAPATPASPTIKGTVEASFPAYLADLETFVNIDTVTGNMAGSKALSELIIKQVQALGGTAETVVHEGKPGGVHVVGRFKGDGKGKFLVMVHYDTVPGTKGGQYRFRYDAKTGIGYGPGVADSKASVVQSLYLMKAFNQLGYKPYEEIVIHFDSEEEGGSPMQKKLALDLAQKADYVLVADTGRPDYGIVTKRKASGTYTITVKGKAGHSGNSPQASANALIEAGYLITKLNAMASPMPGGATHNPDYYTLDAMTQRGEKDRGQYIPANSVNVAMVSTTNTKTNVIPDNAEIKVNVRSYDNAEQARIEKAIYALESDRTIAGVTVKVEGKSTTAAMEVTPAAAKMIGLYKGILKREYDINVSEWIAGGNTLANLTAQIKPTIDCVGVDADPLAEHTDHEYVDLKTFAPRTVTLIHFIGALSQGQ